MGEENQSQINSLHQMCVVLEQLPKLTDLQYWGRLIMGNKTSCVALIKYAYDL